MYFELEWITHVANCCAYLYTTRFPPSCIISRDRFHAPMLQTASQTKHCKREIWEENLKAAIASFMGVPQSSRSLHVTLDSKNRNENVQMLYEWRKWKAKIPLFRTSVFQFKVEWYKLEIRELTYWWQNRIRTFYAVYAFRVRNKSTNPSEGNNGYAIRQAYLKAKR